MSLYARKWEYTGDGWNSPVDILKSYSGVVVAKYLDTMSSAGDWWGYFILKDKTKKKPYKVCFFSQWNRYPKRGYGLFADNPVLKLSKIPPTLEVLEQYLWTVATR